MMCNINSAILRMQILASHDDVDVVERILKHLKVWDPEPDTITPAGPDPPYRKARPYP